MTDMEKKAKEFARKYLADNEWFILDVLERAFMAGYYEGKSDECFESAERFEKQLADVFKRQ